MLEKPYHWTELVLLVAISAIAMAALLLALLGMSGMVSPLIAVLWIASLMVAAIWLSSLMVVMVMWRMINRLTTHLSQTREETEVISNVARAFGMSLGKAGGAIPV